MVIQRRTHRNAPGIQKSRDQWACREKYYWDNSMERLEQEWKTIIGVLQKRVGLLGKKKWEPPREKNLWDCGNKKNGTNTRKSKQRLHLKFHTTLHK